MTSHRISRQAEEFRTHSIFKLILRYSIPAMIGNFMLTIYNVVDRIFISQVMGEDAIAGIGITFQLFMIFIAVGVMFGVGGGTLVSLRLGEGKIDEAEHILGATIWVFIIGGILTCIFGQIFLKQIIFLFGGSDVTYPYAASYMRILLCFIAFDFMAMGTNNIIRAEGSPRFSMWNIAVGCIANIILDYIFIFPLNMGIAGAAWATAISKTLSSGLMFWHFRFNPNRMLTLRRKYFHFDGQLFKAMVWIGMSPFIMHAVNALVGMVMNQSLRHYGGDTAIAVVTINGTIMSLINIPVFGIMLGYQPIAGYNYGAGLFLRVREVLLKALFLGTVVGCSVLLPIMIAPEPVFSLFCKNSPHLAQDWSYSLRMFMMGVPLWPLLIIGVNFFQATGRPARTIGLNIFRNGICFISLILLLPLFWGINGIWLSIPLSDLIASSVIIFFIVHEMKQLKKRGNQPFADAQQVT